jgi:hypothetical protein
MTTKELRQNMRRGSFIIPFLLLQLLAVIATVIEFKNGDVAKMHDGVGALNVVLLGNSGPFWAIVGAVCLVIMPLGGIILMGQELEEGNHELLLLTKLDRWRVVIGKFLCLWGLCVLSFVSLLPFVVVRYVLGGVEWWYEMACALTIVGGSAIICAGVIGASAFRTILGRIVILMVFLVSMFIGCGVALGGSMAVGRGDCGVIYHLNALCAVVSYVTIGLALARSQLRLVVLAYEAKPSAMVIALMVFAPFGIATVTAVSIGYGGFVGLLALALVAWRVDVSPKAPAWVKPPVANTPPPPLPDAGY